MKTVKVAILVEDIESHETIIDLDTLHPYDESSYSELLSIAKQYYSRCEHRKVISVIKFDRCKVSYSF